MVKIKGQRAAPWDGMIEDALSTAQSAIEELRDEVREVVENMGQSDGLAATSRYQTLSDTADVLDSVDSFPDEIPEAVASLNVRATQDTRRSAGSRAGRLANATALMSATISALEEWIDDNEEHEELDEVQTLRDDVESAMSELEAAEFPGMMG